MNCNNIAVSYLSYLLIFVKCRKMSVYSFPLKDSGCFTVAYNRLLLAKILFYISMYWEMLETLLSIICYIVQYIRPMHYCMRGHIFEM